MLLVVAGFLCICFSPFVHGQSKDEKNEKSYLELQERLPSWITSARDFINTHLQIDPDCDIKYAQDSEIIPRYVSSENLKGWLFEDKVFINSNHKIKWKLKDFIVFKVHEDLHTGGKCLGDRKPSDLPICSLFGENIYRSEDLNNAIKKHLKKELDAYENQIAVR